MKAALETIIGLVFDDWYLLIGVFLTIILTKLAIMSGVSAEASGFIMIVLIVATLFVSLMVEYRKKTKKQVNE